MSVRREFVKKENRRQRAGGAVRQRHFVKKNSSKRKPPTSGASVQATNLVNAAQNGERKQQRESAPGSVRAVAIGGAGEADPVGSRPTAVS